MAQFTEDELNEIKNGLIDLTQNLLRYDLKASKQYSHHMIDEQEDESSEEEQDTQGMYAWYSRSDVYYVTLYYTLVFSEKVGERLRWTRLV